MILTIPLYPGTVLANVRYYWIAAGLEGVPLSTGITQPDSTRPVFRFDVVPPNDAEEIVAYDSTNPTNWNVGGYKIAATATVIVPPSGVPPTPTGQWAIPVADDVLSEFTPSELASIATLMGSAGPDYSVKVAVILARVVAEIRGYIRSGNYALDANPNTIPLSLFNDSISIARWRFLISVPNFKQLQTEERKQLYADAMTRLTAVGQGEFAVEPPTIETNPPALVNWNSENKFIMRTHPVPRPGVQFPPANAYANPDAPPDIGNDP